MSPCEQGHGGHKHLPGVFPWLGHLSLVYPSWDGRELGDSFPILSLLSQKLG